MVNSKTLLVAAGLSLSAQAAVMPPQIQLQQAFKFDDDEVITVSKKEDPLGDLYFQDSWKFHLPYFMKPTIETESLQSKITMETLHKSANALYALATESIDEFGHPTRVIGSRGHEATLDWIKARLYKLSNYYDISEQEFNAIYGRVKNATVQFEDGSYLENVKGMALTNGIDPFYGQIVEIPNLGCELHDFLSVGQIKNNTIALMKRGECSFADKSKNAKKAGFKAAIIYNNEKAPKSISGSLGEEVNATIATVGVPLAQGEELKNAIIKSKNNLHVKFAVDAYVKSVSTKNVIAETKRGDPENVVSLGSHTDGVETGPGINDDGSGTISLLTVAEQLAGYKVNNKVRFMFVAAEEEGLLGSAYYANSLTPEENQKIRLMMDYDMMASPNYQFQVYDANNTVNPKGSEEIKNLYIDYYLSHGHNYTLIPFDGRSDYVGFLDAGIPAGGIAAGAEALNTDNGKVLDQCYHELCDDVSNLNFEAFLVNTKLIAHSVATYANDLSDFPLREVTEVEETNFQYKASNLLF